MSVQDFENSWYPHMRLELMFVRPVHVAWLCGLMCAVQQILADMEAVLEAKAPRQPRFVVCLQSAELTEGQK